MDVFSRGRGIDQPWCSAQSLLQTPVWCIKSVTAPCLRCYPVLPPG